MESEENNSESAETSVLETGDGRDCSVALAFSFEDVVERFEEPERVFNSLNWVDFVGIVSAKPQTVINSFCAKRDIHIDFFSGPEGGKLDGLERAKREQMYDADRYIYVGATKRDEVTAEKAGWEYLDIEDSAEKAGWKI